MSPSLRKISSSYTSPGVGILRRTEKLYWSMTSSPALLSIQQKTRDQLSFELLETQQHTPHHSHCMLFSLTKHLANTLGGNGVRPCAVMCCHVIQSSQKTRMKKKGGGRNLSFTEYQIHLKHPFVNSSYASKYLLWHHIYPAPRPTRAGKTYF